MALCFISIGSNIDKDINIPSSLHALKQLFGELLISSVYQSKAVGFEGEDFYNLIVGFNTNLDVNSVAQRLREIELNHGRCRDSKKFSARTLDLDLVLYDDLILNDGRLQIPRAEIEDYAFVLEPLAEIAPDLRHPISHRTYAEIWDSFDKRRIDQQKVIPEWLNTV
ncbi:2-amino-4-hydroxy-6-hydroxymethyldihydropteridine diphosphokinase [Methylicorpusculum oleiharenae]|uniref:2-amino-4-hydroxy-6- hydroxymethyldihydropteridine diphosphokinase n=1 Tax=Methylicorpusculum oleiharenae TaxID=1338687 RepID=UPI00135785C9|nr:2-amino-4-hydroxy-6-hydroxymethyldihydropteridine diphosphokinase [Methylicorpusculum oleiharenae]MCD2449786.1 2-amino-4-hydroxy-6-hydroxymethyldihydropteridine diphosphokinase [Methylicorpusculum oleiharenae]